MNVVSLQKQIPNEPSRPPFLKTWMLVALVILAITGIGTGIFFYIKTQQLSADPVAAGRKELEEVQKKVGILIELPENETPTLATVTDKEKLRDQPFFSRAEQGDKVLIYIQAKKAYLYRPSINKLIEVAPLNITQNSDGISK